MAQNFPVRPRYRVLIDNDFGGDPDGLIQLAHHLLSPTVEVVGIIVSHLRKEDTWAMGSSGIEPGIKEVERILELTGMKVPIFRGSDDPMLDLNIPVESNGVDFIIDEINRKSDLPLFIVCGGSLTQVASAYLRKPETFSNVIVIWIGGGEYSDFGITTPDAPLLEYNTHEDVLAAQVIFNQSQIKLWQVPRNTYRQALVSFAELDVRLKRSGKLGEYLYEKLASTVNWWDQKNRLLGETYCFGDSALVLLTALHTPYEPDQASSSYVDLNAPFLGIDGGYIKNPNGRKIRVYTTLDTRLLFEDFFAKLKILESK